MLVVMHVKATQADIDRVCDAVSAMGFQPLPMPGAQRTTVGLVGNDGRVDGSNIEAMPGVAEIIYVSSPFKQVSREWRNASTLVAIAPGVVFGGTDVPVIAGPCSVESEAQILASARAVRDAGAVALRGGAFKPRSSPYSFQGLGKHGLELLQLAKRETGLAIVTEAMDDEGAHLVAEYADCIQIGARNMQNYSLLKTVGRLRKPVLLKRGLAATVQELLLSAEYILSEGNDQVILCERGVRTWDPLLAQHVRPQLHSHGAETVAPPHHRRSEPRHGDPRPGDANGTGRRGRRRRRYHHRGPSRPEPGPQRRGAVALPRPVRRSRAAAPPDQRGHRPQHLVASRARIMRP